MRHSRFLPLGHHARATNQSGTLSQICWKLLLLFVFLFSSLAVGCTAPDGGETAPLRGQVLLWHSWSLEDRTTLSRITEQFHEIYPDVEIITVAIPANELERRYRETAALGLGPDIVIGSDRWIPNFVENNLIKEVPPEKFDLISFTPDALQTTRAADSLYGIPLSQNATVLYYNKQRLLHNAPPRTFDTLLNHVNDGEVVALNVDFEQAYWGISTFGNGLFDSDGQLAETSEGLLGWLNWLDSAQRHPNIILSRDTNLLQDMFIAGTAQYYVGWADELPYLLGSMGETQVGIAPLPYARDPERTAVPLLRTEALLFNASSAARQLEISYAFANFLTNTTQSAILMRETQRIPANRLLQISSEVDELQFAIAQQISMAAPPPTNIPFDTLLETGSTIYNNVLTGVEQPTGATISFLDGLESALSE